MNIPLSSISLPPLSERKRAVNDEKVREIAESMRLSTQLQPIVVERDGEVYRLIAGMHRYLAASSLGWKEIRAEVKAFEDARYAELAEIDENLTRNDLTVLERAEHNAQRWFLLDEMGLAAKPHRQAKGETVSPLTMKTDDVAKAQRMTKRAVQYDRQIAKSIHPQLVEAIKKHDLPIQNSTRELLRLARLPQADQVVAVNNMLVRTLEGGAPITVLDAVRRGERFVSSRLASDVVAPEGKYRTIVVDPPWSGEDTGDVSGVKGNIEPSYETMSFEEIAGLPVADLAQEDDCDLYLWVTKRTHEFGYELLRRWQFRCVSELVWLKHRPGTGRYFVGQHETVLFGKRGTAHLSKAGVPDVFEGKRTTHSTKPEEFYELVRTCSPGPRISLFEREDKPGFTCHGTMERNRKAAV